MISLKVQSRKASSVVPLSAQAQCQPCVSLPWYRSVSWTAQWVRRAVSLVGQPLVPEDVVAAVAAAVSPSKSEEPVA
jgi:hypothetical protein